MAAKTLFKDALDYIFIDNGIAPDSYLISNEIAASNHLVGAVVTAAANGVIINSNSSGNSGSSNNFFINTSSASATATATATAALASTAASSPAIVAAGMENLYSNVAIGLGTMLINDSLLQDINSTSLFGLLANESDLSKNGTDDDIASEDIAELVKMAATSIVLGLMILITIIGNVFVIAAIILERNLQNVANYLVASLAVADLFVACLVMPLGAVYEISQGWILGPELCDIWTSCDVLCCTASILHLVAIATDRYWAVTNIDYIHSRTSKRVFLMIFCVWFAAVIVSLAPQFGWKDPDYLQRIEQQKCMVSQDVAYQVFATCCTFYVPLLVILVLYWKIYQTARKRIHRRRPRPIDVTANNNQPDLSQKKRKRLKLRIGKFSGDKGKSGATLGLVEGNSTNTVNTVEDTEFSSSNVDSKSRAGIEVTTIFSNPEEAPTTSTSQISTVSHLVALANQQHHHQHQQPSATTTTTTTNKIEQNQNAHNSHQLQQHLHEHHQQHHLHQQQHHHHHHTHVHQQQQQIAIVPTTGAAATAANGTTTNAIQSATTTTTTTDKQSHNSAAQPIISAAAATTPTAVTDDSGDVLEDHQLQQQLQQVAAQTTSATTNTTAAGGGTTTSAATTITSISALSPQTPLNSSCGGITQLTAAAAAAPTSGAGHGPPTATTASNQVTPVPLSKQSHQNLSSIPNPHSKVTKRKETLEAKRERKAAKTLAIITGAFVVCWLPFFVLALLMPLCDGCEVNDAIASFFLWMGYFNSTLNPVIYTIFSPEFRQAFKRILFGGHRPVHYRSGKI